MALTNTQYEQIMREYDDIRTLNRHIRTDRIKEIETLSPEYNRIYKKIGELAGRAAADALEKKDTSRLKKEMHALESEKEALLVSLGKPKDYLAPVYSCHLCNDTGFIDGNRCACFKKKAIELIYRDSNLRHLTKDIDFDSFKTDIYSDETKDSSSGISAKAAATDALIKAKAFASNFDTTGGNIFIYGETGVGKTLLSTCIAKALINTTHSVVYLTAVDLFEKLEKYDENSPILECDLLIIDDLGTELSNSFTTSKLFYCINERILRKKSIIISTNLNLNQLRDSYTDRIFSRILNSFTIIKLFGEDMRGRRFYS